MLLLLIKCTVFIKTLAYLSFILFIIFVFLYQKVTYFDIQILLLPGVFSLKPYPADHLIKYNIKHETNRCISFDTQYTGK